MCYHTSVPSKKKLVEQLPEYSVHYDIEPYYHVSGFTRPFLPVSINTNYRTVESAQWRIGGTFRSDSTTSKQMA